MFCLACTLRYELEELEELLEQRTSSRLQHPYAIMLDCNHVRKVYWYIHHSKLNLAHFKYNSQSEPSIKLQSTEW